MRFLLFLCLTAGLFAQSNSPVSISGGFKIGAPINDPSVRNSVWGSYTQGRWTGGPAIELHLPRNFSVEFDALYRSSRSSGTYTFTYDQSVHAYQATNASHSNVWDLPLMLKYRFRFRNIRPFLAAGYQWTRESAEGTQVVQCTGPTGSCIPAGSGLQDARGGTFRSVTNVRGPVAGAGIEFKAGWVRISPEVRVTRPTYGYPREVRVTGLVGFTFGGK